MHVGQLWISQPAIVSQCGLQVSLLGQRLIGDWGSWQALFEVSKDQEWLPIFSNYPTYCIASHHIKLFHLKQMRKKSIPGWGHWGVCRFSLVWVLSHLESSQLFQCSVLDMFWIFIQRFGEVFMTRNTSFHLCISLHHLW